MGCSIHIVKSFKKCWSGAILLSLRWEGRRLLKGKGGNNEEAEGGDQRAGGNETGGGGGRGWDVKKEGERPGKET